MIETLTLEKRQIEFISDKTRCDMRGKLWMAFHGRKPSWASAFIRDGVGIAYTKREVRVMIEKKRRYVIVKNKKQNVRFLRREPMADRFVALEDRCPIRVGLFMRIECETNRWCMRAGDCADYRGHNMTP
jgi:hypothetical protein